eukprot:scaffold625_cov420-Prasinococcus_capsulatus_cf.AAC.16
MDAQRVIDSPPRSLTEMGAVHEYAAPNRLAIPADAPLPVWSNWLPWRVKAQLPCLNLDRGVRPCAHEGSEHVCHLARYGHAAEFQSLPQGTLPAPPTIVPGRDHGRTRGWPAVQKLGHQRQPCDCACFGPAPLRMHQEPGGRSGRKAAGQARRLRLSSSAFVCHSAAARISVSMSDVIVAVAPRCGREPPLTGRVLSASPSCRCCPLPRRVGVMLPAGSVLVRHAAGATCTRPIDGRTRLAARAKGARRR